MHVACDEEMRRCTVAAVSVLRADHKNTPKARAESEMNRQIMVSVDQRHIVPCSKSPPTGGSIL